MLSGGIYSIRPLIRFSNPGIPETADYPCPKVLFMPFSALHPFIIFQIGVFWNSKCFYINLLTTKNDECTIVQKPSKHHGNRSRKPSKIAKCHFKNAFTKPCIIFGIKTLISNILTLYHKTILGRFSCEKCLFSSIFVHFWHENCKMMKRHPSSFPRTFPQKCKIILHSYTHPARHPTHRNSKCRLAFSTESVECVGKNRKKNI